MTNPNHDAKGRFATYGGVSKRIEDAAQTGDVNKYFEERENLDKIAPPAHYVNPFIGHNPNLKMEVAKKREIFEANKNVAFLSLHGSHLYGMSHPNSDIDFYTVMFDKKSRKSSQKVVGDLDNYVISFTHFIELANKGTHQALESMFSTRPIGDRIEHYRKNFFVGTDSYEIYLRTIKKFALDEGDVKRNRHAVRLTLNLNEMAKTGRFTTELTPQQLDTVARIGAIRDKEQYVEELEKISYLKPNLSSSL